ncbi:MAG: NAD(P)/FAD-dependent oxidoreductase [Actinobacteria bacterium]|nr:NAD(P)/FAD-dependent oxidoreductase [Actinomycetota bacterium]
MEESLNHIDTYDAVIGGTGIGGLTCGAILAKEGAKLLVIEKKEKPGGYLAPIEKKGYNFQFPQMMTGCGAGGDITGILDHLEIHVDMTEVNPYHRFIFPDHDISTPSSIDELMNVLKDEFQPQTSNLNFFFNHVRKVHEKSSAGIRLKTSGGSSGLKMLLHSVLHPSLYFQAGGGSTASKLLGKFFTDQRLISILAAPWPRLGTPPWRLSSLSFIDFLVNQSEGAYVPNGGFQVLTESLVASIKQNGGEFIYSDEVEELTVDRGRLTGLATRSKRKIGTTAFISDIDTKRTFLELLKEEDCPAKLRTRISGQTTSISGLTVFLGMSKTLTPDEMNFGVAFSYPSYEIEETCDRLNDGTGFPEPDEIPWALSIPTLHDPTRGPEGKTVLSISVPAIPYSFMDNWGIVRGESAVESSGPVKEKYAEIAVSAVSKVFPNLISNVEAYEAVTPLDFEEYVTSSHGCWYDIASEPGQSYFNRLGPGTPVKGLYLTGSKSCLGGTIHGSMLGGLFAANHVLRERVIQ